MTIWKIRQDINGNLKEGRTCNLTRKYGNASSKEKENLYFHYYTFALYS